MIADDVKIEGEGEVFIPHPHLVNLYGCTIGEGTTIGPFVEIQKGAVIGRNCIISSHSFICEGVTIGDGVFIGHGVIFCNEKWPMANRPVEWKLHPEQRVRVGDGAVLGSGARILPGVTIGEGAVIGCGLIVTRDISPHMVARQDLRVHEYPLATVEEIGPLALDEMIDACDEAVAAWVEKQGCTCNDNCLTACKGDCGCEYCRRAWSDFLSTER